MPGNFTITSRTTGTILTAAFYNGDRQDIVDHMEPQYIDDESSNLAAMQAVADPGEVSSEDLATTLKGEIQRLRYAIQDTKAFYDSSLTRWYSSPTRLSLTLGTLTADKPILNGTATWNEGSTTFNGIKVNITDTASASASKLLDLQVASSTKFNVTKAGLVTAASSLVAPSIGPNSSQVHTLPAVSSDTVALLAASQTLSNKTLATPVITTAATCPLLIGGTGTTSTLTLQPTSGVGTTGADIIFQNGNNGATEVLRVRDNGSIGFGTTGPQGKLHINGSTSKIIVDAALFTDHTAKFNTQGAAWSAVTHHAIIFNDTSSARPEIAWLRGTRTYPEFAIRQHTTADNGGEVYAGAGTGAPTKVLAITSSTLTLADPYDLVLGTSTGTKIGTATTQKLGFYNATPVVQPGSYTQTYSTADKTHANFTSGDLTGITSSTTGTALAEPDAAYVQATWQQNARRIQDQFNALRADVADLKQLVNSIIDDLQTLGLVG